MSQWLSFDFFSEVARAPVIGWYWMVQIGHCSFGAKTSYLGVGFGDSDSVGPSKIQKWFFPFQFCRIWEPPEQCKTAKSFPRWFQKRLRVCYQICQFLCVFTDSFRRSGGFWSQSSFKDHPQSSNRTELCYCSGQRVANMLSLFFTWAPFHGVAFKHIISCCTPLKSHCLKCYSMGDSTWLERLKVLDIDLFSGSEKRGFWSVHILIGGLEHGFYFPFHIWDVILPIDLNSYFSQG